jgi:putative two-component system response regulator
MARSNDVKDKELIDIIRRLAAVSEENGDDSLFHRERVRVFCTILGKSLTLSSTDTDLIAYASLLHDVGKARLPRELVMKTGSLDPYEWDVMKRHTTYGAEILRGSPSPLLQMGEVIALTHHERWDGSGYPQGLRGEEIPLSGRIVAIADVFDALTTKRSYKKEVSVDNAVQLVKEASGTLFEPKIVEAFLENCDEILRAQHTGLLRALPDF